MRKQRRLCIFFSPMLSVGQQPTNPFFTTSLSELEEQEAELEENFLSLYG